MIHALDLSQMTAQNAPFCEQGTVVADPPWNYRNRSNNGAAEKHYPTMTDEQIAAIPVASVVAADAVLYLWATWPKLPEAMAVLEAWGFTYKTGFPWVKLQKDNQTPAWGTGFWVRGCSEPVLIGVRGKAKPPKTAAYMGLLGPGLRHSRKPKTIYELAEQHPGPYIEFFAREERAGWTSVGNEVLAATGERHTPRGIQKPDQLSLLGGSSEVRPKSR